MQNAAGVTAGRVKECNVVRLAPSAVYVVGTNCGRGNYLYLGALQQLRIALCSSPHNKRIRILNPLRGNRAARVILHLTLILKNSFQIWNCLICNYFHVVKILNCLFARRQPLFPMLKFARRLLLFPMLHQRLYAAPQAAAPYLRITSLTTFSFSCRLMEARMDSSWK